MDPQDTTIDHLDIVFKLVNFLNLFNDADAETLILPMPRIIIAGERSGSKGFSLSDNFLSLKICNHAWPFRT